MVNFKSVLIGALVAMTVLFNGTAANAQLFNTTATATLTVTAEADLDDYWVVKVANTLGDAAATNGNYWTLPTFRGWLDRIEINPGATAPTDNYDVYLLDDKGVDVLGGAGLDRDTATSEVIAPVHKNGSTVPASTAVQWIPVYMYGPAYLSIVGNTQDGALVETFLYLRKQAP